MGVAAAAGVFDAAGDGVAVGVATAAGVFDAAGAGVADGLAVGEAEGAGVCANEVPANAIAITGTSATSAERNVRIRFIQTFSIHPKRSRRVPTDARKRRNAFLTRGACFVP